MHFFRRALILKAGILHGRGAPVGNGKGESLWNTVLTGIRTAAHRCWAGAVCALPTLEPGGTAIDYARAGALVDEAVRGGITYFDVAYPYHGGGAEKFIGAALEKYPRESFYLATKMPLWKLETQEDMEQVFNEQLGQLPCGLF